MNEDQARTILDKVQWDWGAGVLELLDDDPADLAQDLEIFPVESVTIGDLLKAIEYVRRNPWRAE